jgi:tRNA pseudouridine32 synthase/23S rRNA pseudouridine746 synthase
LHSDVTGEIPPGADGIELVYVDEAIIVVDKPAGLLSVPGRGPDKQDCLSRRVAMAYNDALVVHRLDMATSGLLVMARSPESQRALGLAFASRTVRKRYIAVVDGCLQPTDDQWQTINLPIQVDWPNRPMRIIAMHGGQQSVTRLRVLTADHRRKTTRVELEPLTGRTHQLRVHLQAIGHPILGDALYNHHPEAHGATRLLLHSQDLSFAHPVTAAAMQFTSPAPF